MNIGPIETFEVDPVSDKHNKIVGRLRFELRFLLLQNLMS
jgi:hypothetical protein